MAASDAFLGSLPPDYARAFTPAEQAEHEAWVSDRGEGEVRARVCGWLGPTLALVQVAADDAPGLIARWTASCREAGLRLRAALVCTRELSPARSEAFDFFWVTAPQDLLDEAVGLWLQGLGNAGVPAVAAAGTRAEPAASPAPIPGETQASVSRSARPGCIELGVSGPDRDGLANALAEWASLRGLSVVEASLQTTEHGQVDNRLLLRGTPSVLPEEALEELRGSLLDLLREVGV